MHIKNSKTHNTHAYADYLFSAINKYFLIIYFLFCGRKSVDTTFISSLDKSNRKSRNKKKKISKSNI